MMAMLQRTISIQISRYKLISAFFYRYKPRCVNSEQYMQFLFQDAVNCLKKQAYDALDDVAFDDKMKDNYPVSLSSAMNTSITDGDASIPLTDRAGTNYPDLHVTSQGRSMVFFSRL